MGRVPVETQQDLADLQVDPDVIDEHLVGNCLVDRVDAVGEQGGRRQCGHDCLNERLDHVVVSRGDRKVIPIPQEHLGHERGVGASGRIRPEIGQQRHGWVRGIVHRLELDDRDPSRQRYGHRPKAAAQGMLDHGIDEIRLIGG